MIASKVVAFHGPVRLLSWAESSSQEFRVKLELLEGRDALAHFEAATRRTKKRAGQRYRAVWQSEGGEAIQGPAELLFCGADWSHQAGATVKFAVHPGDEDWFRERPTADVDDSVERLFLGLVQLDDDDRPLDQTKAALAEWADGLVGGPKSKAAARRCLEPEFQMFVAQRLGQSSPASVALCDTWIKAQCGIHTKRLLDYSDPTTHEPFWGRYERRVQRPYITWLESRAARSIPRASTTSNVTGEEPCLES